MHIFFSKNLNFFASTCPPASFVMAKLIQIKQLIAALVLVFYPPLWANGGSVVSFIHAKYGFSSMGSRCYYRR